MLWRSSTHLGNLRVAPRTAKGHDATAGYRLYPLDALEADSAVARWHVTPTASRFFNVLFISGATGVNIAQRLRLTPTAVKFVNTAVAFKGITGAHANWGFRTILTGGSSVVTNNKVNRTSFIKLFPVLNTGVTNPHCYEKAVSGAASFLGYRAQNRFKIMLRKNGNESITGRVYYEIINTDA